MAVVGGIALGATSVYSANQQSSAARDAARTQARGVENAQQDTIAATNRARSALDPYGNYSPQPQMGPMQQPQMGSIQQQDPVSVLGPRPAGVGRSGMVQQAMWDARAMQLQNEQQQNPQQNPQQNTMPNPNLPPDPRNEYLGGVQTGAAFTNQGYGQAQSALSPLANMAQPYLDEQYNLLGMGGQQAQQDAYGRISDPLVAEQERALNRNYAQLGGVGGGQLAALADMTRQRTQANMGERFAQLGSASSPGLNALQQIANLRLNQGLNMSDIFRGAGQDLSTMETNRRQSLANIELGQGSQLAQLSQNLGNARAGGSAFAAQQTPALVQGLNAGLGAYMGMGGNFGTPPPMAWQGNPNQFGGMA